MTYCIILFDSTHHVLKAEKLLLEAGIRNDIIPTPKDLSSDCGMSIRTDAAESDLNTIDAILKMNSIHFTVIRRDK